jgi:hypothetical protein
MRHDFPRSVWSGSFELFGVTINCHVLEDGQRIIEAESVERLFSAMTSPETTASDSDEKALEAFSRWINGHSSETPS